MGTLNVSEVGMSVGMDDPSYFYRCFKSHYGVAPSKYGKSGGEGCRQPPRGREAPILRMIVGRHIRQYRFFCVFLQPT